MRLMFGMFIGIGIAYFFWAGDPPYIGAVKGDEANAISKPYILTSSGGVQVAIIHGYADNEGVCSDIKELVAKEVIVRDCIPYTEAPYRSPWWHFWGPAPNHPR